MKKVLVAFDHDSGFYIPDPECEWHGAPTHSFSPATWKAYDRARVALREAKEREYYLRCKARRLPD